MKHLIISLFVAAQCLQAVAAPVSDLAAGQTGRIEFTSITPPDRWQFVRKNKDNTKEVTVYGDLLMPRRVNPAFYSAWPMYQRPVNTNGAKYAGHIPMYPGMCNIRYRADATDKATAPIFFALPDRDKEDFQDVSVCKRYAQELAAAGNAVTSKEYKGAYHAWDGGGRRFRYENSHSAKPCDLELEMTDKPGGGVGRNAKDLKTGKTITSYDEWFTTVKGCMAMTSAGLGGNAGQSDAVVADVLKFMGLK